jgi:ubiquitin-conjugating enzyme E2 D/E
MAALLSLSQEWKIFQKIAPGHIFAEPINDNLFHWHATILGPSDTPFEDGAFILDIFFTEEHPFEPPKCTMKTKMFHPNISSTGEIYIEIFDRDWVPTLTIEKILLSISSILHTPVMDNPINHEAARWFRKDRDKYNSIARAYTLKYAIESSIHTEKYQDLHPELLHAELNDSSSYYVLNFPFLLLMLTTTILIFAVFICILAKE